jgi:hypothetical protein
MEISAVEKLDFARIDRNFGLFEDLILVHNCIFGALNMLLDLVAR